MVDTTPRALSTAASVGVAPAQARPRKTLKQLARRKSTTAVLFAAPLLAVLLGLIIYPGLFAIYLSMLNKAQTKFIWFGNYTFLFTRPTFWMVVEQSCIFAITAVFFKALIGVITMNSTV